MSYFNKIAYSKNAEHWRYIYKISLCNLHNSFIITFEGRKVSEQLVKVYGYMKYLI